jgi:transcriptional regulator with PAS, ATPase and Fis domain
VAHETIEEVPSVGESEAATPIIVMVHTGTTPAHRVYRVVGEVRLGREIVGGGRTEEVADGHMSQKHASVRFVRDTWRIADAASRNGTFVNGDKITGEVSVAAAQVVLRLGHTVFVLIRNGHGYSDAVDRIGDVVIGPELARVYEQVRRDAVVDTMLLHGENGSGKELVARLYHDAGPRRTGPFIAVNCATIQASLAGAQLFGSRKGAYTEARDAPGFIQSAHGGTLFLDEVAELPKDVQSQLLRVIENREVTPLGATSPIAVSIGVIAASHRTLRKAVAGDDFREDLFYRLSRHSVIELPPLRARKVDIARFVVRELAATLRELAATDGSRADHSLFASAKLIEQCCIRPWPGNVRELLGAVRQAARRALARPKDPKTESDTTRIVRAGDLPEQAGFHITPEPEAAPDKPAKARPADYTKDQLLAALDQAKGNLSEATRDLGLHRTQMYRLLRKYGIKRDDADDDNDDDDDED